MWLKFFFSICTALFHLSLTSKFALSCQKAFGVGVLEKKGRQRERASVITLIIASLTVRAQQLAEWLLKGTLCEKNPNKSQVRSFLVRSSIFAVKNKQKQNVLVGRCAVSCDLICLCSNAENTEQFRELLKEANTHIHLNFSLWATHLSSSTWYPRCRNTAAKNEH